MERNSSGCNFLAISYLGLRKAIGMIGLLLPFVLAIGEELIYGAGIQSSISSYYYTGMRDVFVGSMCAIGVFLLSYKGYERQDDIAGNIACVFAVGLALIPTSPDLNPTEHQRLYGDIHLVFATGFFLVLAYFSLWLFRKTDNSKPPTQQKLQRNLVYMVCGYMIVGALMFIVLVKQLPVDAPLMHYDPVFWLESIAVVSFGVSWLTKGEVVLRDTSDL